MPELFDDHFLLEKLTKLIDPLVKLDEHIDWKIFLRFLMWSSINLRKCETLLNSQKSYCTKS